MHGHDLKISLPASGGLSRQVTHSGAAQPQDSSGPDEIQLRTLWVGGISDKADEEILFELFQNAGPLRKITLPVDKETKRQKTFAFVEYHHEESVEYAYKLLNGTELFGQRLHCQNKATGLGIQPHLRQNSHPPSSGGGRAYGKGPDTGEVPTWGHQPPPRNHNRSYSMSSLTSQFRNNQAIMGFPGGSSGGMSMMMNENHWQQQQQHDQSYGYRPSGPPHHHQHQRSEGYHGRGPPPPPPPADDFYRDDSRRSRHHQSSSRFDNGHGGGQQRHHESRGYRDRSSHDQRDRRRNY